MLLSILKEIFWTNIHHPRVLIATMNAKYINQWLNFNSVCLRMCIVFHKRSHWNKSATVFLFLFYSCHFCIYAETYGPLSEHAKKKVTLPSCGQNDRSRGGFSQHCLFVPFKATVALIWISAFQERAAQQCHLHRLQPSPGLCLTTKLHIIYCFLSAAVSHSL